MVEQVNEKTAKSLNTSNAYVRFLLATFIVAATYKQFSNLVKKGIKIKFVIESERIAHRTAIRVDEERAHTYRQCRASAQHTHRWWKTIFGLAMLGVGWATLVWLWHGDGGGGCLQFSAPSHCEILNFSVWRFDANNFFRQNFILLWWVAAGVVGARVSFVRRTIKKKKRKNWFHHLIYFSLKVAFEVFH